MVLRGGVPSDGDDRISVVAFFDRNGNRCRWLGRDRNGNVQWIGDVMPGTELRNRLLSHSRRGSRDGSVGRSGGKSEKSGGHHGQVGIHVCQHVWLSR